MKLRGTITLLALFSACGRLQIGSYAQQVETGAGGGHAGGNDEGGEGGSAPGGAANGGDAHGGAGIAGAGSGGVAEGGAGAGGDGGAAGDGERQVDPSCRGIEEQCSGFSSCCSSSLVESGDFELGGGIFGRADAHVSQFHADTLEVSVARFALFLDAFEEWIEDGNPRPGAGAHPLVPGTGWRAEWPLAESRESIEDEIRLCNNPTYYSRESNPELPMNCVEWYEAFAFCIWDGKRLPTEAEWEFAAKDGERDLIYPWGDTPEPRPDFAVFRCLLDGSPQPDCSIDDFSPVGSRPLGRTRHGLYDMAGSVAEWVFDPLVEPYPDPCNDCASLENKYPGSRGFRGGGYSDQPVVLETERRNSTDGYARIDFLGFRCVRSADD